MTKGLHEFIGSDRTSSSLLLLLLFLVPPPPAACQQHLTCQQGAESLQLCSSAAGAPSREETSAGTPVQQRGLRVTPGGAAATICPPATLRQTSERQ